MDVLVDIDFRFDMILVFHMSNICIIFIINMNE